MEFSNTLIILIGLFSLLGAIFNWDWFMNNRRARIIVTLFKRTGARIFYGLLGTGLIVGGVYLMF